MNSHPAQASLPPRNLWTSRLASAAASALLFVSGAEARTWTSSDGTKTFEGDLKSHDPDTGMVGVTLANGKTMNFNQSKLAAADIDSNYPGGKKYEVAGFVFWQGEEDGGSGNGHYGGNAGTYMNVGQAMGRELVILLGAR